MPENGETWKKILFISYDCVGAPVDSVQVPSTPPCDFSSAILNIYALDQNRFSVS